MVNRNFFAGEKEFRRSDIAKLAQFIGTNKNADLCYSMLKYYEKKYSFAELIDKEAARFGLTQELIEVRKMVCS